MLEGSRVPNLGLQVPNPRKHPVYVYTHTHFSDIDIDVNTDVDTRMYACIYAFLLCFICRVGPLEQINIAPQNPHGVLSETSKRHLKRQQPRSDAKSHAKFAAIVQFLTCHFTVVAFRGRCTILQKSSFRGC